jgi:hypothetical protein
LSNRITDKHVKLLFVNKCKNYYQKESGYKINLEKEPNIQIINNKEFLKGTKRLHSLIFKYLIKEELQILKYQDSNKLVIFK